MQPALDLPGAEIPEAPPKPKPLRYSVKSIETLARQLGWTVRRIEPRTLMLVRNGSMVVMLVMPNTECSWVGPDDSAWLAAINKVEGCAGAVVRPRDWRSGHIRNGLIHG